MKVTLAVKGCGLKANQSQGINNGNPFIPGMAADGGASCGAEGLMMDEGCGRK